MNTKPYRKHKSADYSTSKSINGGAEVFVLPPNLLEKLGIKLENIVSSENFPPATDHVLDQADKGMIIDDQIQVEGDSSIQTKTLQNQNESSILETANLMRDSVFLSPTFVSTTSNVISGEVVIASPYRDLKKNGNGKDETTTVKPVKNDVLYNDHKTNNKDHVDISKPDQLTLSPNDNNLVTHIQNQPILDGVSVVTANENVKDKVDDERKEPPNVLLDNTIVNPGSNMFIHGSKPNKNEYKNKKINIINEEVIDISKLYGRKLIHPNLNNNVLTPVTVDMIIPTVEKSLDKVCPERAGTTTNCNDEVISTLYKDKDIEWKKESNYQAVKYDHVNVLSEQGGNCNSLIDITMSSVEYENDVIEVAKNYIKSPREDTVSNDNSICTSNIIIQNSDHIQCLNTPLHNLSTLSFNSEDISCINNISNINIGQQENYYDSQIEKASSKSNIYVTLEIPNSDSLKQSSIGDKFEESGRIVEPLPPKQATDFKMEETVTKKNDIKSEKVIELENNNVQYKKKKTDSKCRSVFNKQKISINGVEKPGGRAENVDGIKVISIQASEKVLKPEFELHHKDQKQIMNKIPQSTRFTSTYLKKTKVPNPKTYERKNKNDQKCLPDFVIEVKVANDLSCSIDSCISDINLDVIDKTEDFCLCGDFGQLRYYEDDGLYEHIHFWKHNDVTTDRDLVFGIYYNNDVLCTTLDDKAELIELMTESPNERSHKICWNEIYGDINNALDSNDDGEQLSDAVDHKIKTIKEEAISLPSAQNDIKNIDNIHTHTKMELAKADKELLHTKSSETSAIDSMEASDVTEMNDIMISSCSETIESTQSRKMRGTQVTEGVSDSKVMNQITNITNVAITKSPEKNLRKRKPSVTVKQEDAPTKNMTLSEPPCKKDVKCGICGQLMSQVEWEEHSSKEHGLIAWKAGETLDLKDKDLRKKIKHKMIDEGFLKCGFCDIEINRFNKFIAHVEQCSMEKELKPDIKINRTRRSERAEESEDSLGSSSLICCGVCKQNVKNSDWIVHICHQHKYIAWKDGETPLNLDDEDLVENHLYNIIKSNGPIICPKCGIDRKYGLKAIKRYLKHIKTCFEDDSAEEDKPLRELKAIKMRKQLKTPAASHVVKCGVCEKQVDDVDWISHIGKEHDYLAWKEGDCALDLDDEDQVWQHLYAITKKEDGLICAKCGIKRKYVKKYLTHIKTCDGKVTDQSISMNMSRSSDIASMLESSDVDAAEKIICGVCSKSISVSNWISHIKKEHNYMAWKEGEQPVITQDEEAIENHLIKIIQEYGSLSCYKCGSAFGVESVKTYLGHVKTCEKEAKPDVSMSTSSIIVKCGVCEQEVENSLWIEHIETAHNYFAWKDGETPPVLEDTESKRLYLMSLLDKVTAFRCVKCDTKKKYAKSFITHLKSCGAPEDDSSDKDMVTCAVCSEEIKFKSWKDHAMNQHYNVAWKVGDPPIDLKSPYGADKYLREYKAKKGKLICKVCGISRISLAGFYVHIIACGKSEEELDEYKNICEICNNKYVCIYKNQHMAWHREQDYAKLRKDNPEEEKEEIVVERIPLGRRRAAVKANNVIEKLADVNQFKHTCATCGFETDNDKKWKRHKCGPETFETNTDSEESEESEDSMTDPEEIIIEVDIPDVSKKKRNRESAVHAKVPDLPFKYKETNYTAQINEDYYKAHFTNEKLFPQWHRCTYEFLTQDQIIVYMPKLEKSCQIKQNVEEWHTIDRFEVIPSPKGFTMFVGASIQCLSWIPPPLDEGKVESINYLAVACHQGDDCPRYNYDELRTHAGLIQLWSFGTFNNKDEPKLILCIAHDFGTVWAMDWCPSGARDICTEVEEDWLRLGLLALACSNGIVYILSVPHPSTIAESDELYVRLKPVAELRLSTGRDRKFYQATAVTWTKQKHHKDVLVGYADGTIAYFDLTNTSPLLLGSENDVPIFYPYRDDRDHNASVSGLDTYPVGAGMVCSASLSGVAAALRPEAPLARVSAHSPATGAAFAPAWPSVLFSVDDIVASQAQCEVDWYGCARRMGSVRMWGGCGRCGRALLHAPPLLRVLRALPPYTDIKRQNVLDIRVTSLTNKRIRENDEHSMLVEPLTYEDVVTRYGVQISFLHQTDKSTTPTRDVFSERFPLSDVTALAFCPAPRHHQRAAVALHAGLLLLIRVW